MGDFSKIYLFYLFGDYYNDIILPIGHKTQIHQSIFPETSPQIYLCTPSPWPLMIFNGHKASNTILKLWSHELSLPNGIWIKTHETCLKIDEPHFLVTNRGQESQCQGHHVASPHLRRHRKAAPQQPRPAAAARRRHRCATGWFAAAHGGEGRGQQPRCGRPVEDLGMLGMGWWDGRSIKKPLGDWNQLISTGKNEDLFEYEEWMAWKIGSQKALQRLGGYYTNVGFTNKKRGWDPDDDKDLDDEGETLARWITEWPSEILRCD